MQQKSGVELLGVDGDAGAADVAQLGAQLVAGR